MLAGGGWMKAEEGEKGREGTVRLRIREYSWRMDYGFGTVWLPYGTALKGTGTRGEDDTTDYTDNDKYNK